MMNGMLPFVPELLEDETLFSYLARVRLLNALGRPRDALKTLFGTRSHIVSADLPCHLDALFHRTNGFGIFRSPRDMVVRATLAPYYLAFTPDDPERFISVMLSGSGSGLKTSLGLVAHGFGAGSEFKICSRCATEYATTFGVIPWLRSHQLPCVSACSCHGNVLIEYPSQTELADRQRLFLPSQVVPKNEAQAPFAAMRLSRLSSELLHAQTHLDPRRLADVYMGRLAEMGFGRAQRIDWKAARQEVRAYYQDFVGVASRPTLVAEWANSNWIRQLCRRTERAVHPHLHLLLAGWLFGSVAELICAVARPPAIVDHTPDAPVASRLISQTALEDRSQSAREISSASGVSVTTVLQKRVAAGVEIDRRPKRLNVRLRQQLVQQLSDGVGLTKIAKEHGLSMSTVARLAVDPQISASREVIKRKRHSERLLRARQRWEALAESKPDGSRAQLRAIDPMIYAWLYRNDRAWLLARGPRALPRTTRVGARVDWTDRDQTTTSLLKLALEQSKAKHPSRSGLLRTIPSGASISKNLWRLPRTQELLGRFVAQTKKRVRPRRMNAG